VSTFPYPGLPCCCCCCCSEPWLHACLNLLHWKLRELDPEGLATVAVSLVKLGVIISNGPWLENYISATSSRLSGMGPDTQANLLSSLAVWKAELKPAWLAMFQLMCVQQAESGMKADTLEQVRGACSNSWMHSAIFRPAWPHSYAAESIGIHAWPVCVCVGGVQQHIFHMLDIKARRLIDLLQHLSWATCRRLPYSTGCSATSVYQVQFVCTVCHCV
jgi:hypothetical protein